MRSNNRQRSRGGRSGGGQQHHKQHHPHNPNRPPNRNQIFDSSGPDVRVRGNAHQVFDKYQALAREAAASGDRIMAEAYWQYADHYYRVIQSMGGFSHRNNQGWGDNGEGVEGAEGQGGPLQQQGQPNGQQQQPNANTNGNGYVQGGGEREHRGERERGQDGREAREESDPGLGGVAFLQTGRGNAQVGPDPAADEQPDISEFAPAGAGRRG